MIAKVWELVCDRWECNSLLHFDEELTTVRAREIASRRYRWSWSSETGDTCQKHRIVR